MGEVVFELSQVLSFPLIHAGLAKYTLVACDTTLLQLSLADIACLAIFMNIILEAHPSKAVFTVAQKMAV